MDVVIITCPRCGHSESFAHPESVPVRKECCWCLAEELIRVGALYRLNERMLELSRYEQKISPSKDGEHMSSLGGLLAKAGEER